MISRKKQARKRLSDEQIDEIVENQAADNSAWEKPIQVRRKRPRSSDQDNLSASNRGKPASRSVVGANVVVLDPDVAELFADSRSVNRALRGLAGIIQHPSEKARP